MQGNLVSKSEFKAKALELFRLVESTRERLIITDHGKPALELRPYSGVKRDPLEILKGSVLSYIRPMDPVSDDDWEASQ